MRNPRISAESADGGRDDTRESWLQRREARVRESIESLATQIGIELPPADLATMQLAFPALYRFARAETVPSAATYRELLRTYIDLRMGYPHAVLPDLQRNERQRFLGELIVRVDIDGQFHFVGFQLHAEVSDPTGRIGRHYRAALTHAAAEPFVPPHKADLAAPHYLEYRLLNPLYR